MIEVTEEDKPYLVAHRGSAGSLNFNYWGIGHTAAHNERMRKFEDCELQRDENGKRAWLEGPNGQKIPLKIVG